MIGDGEAAATPLLNLVLVVAASRNGVIGRDGDLPWRLREDLRRFKRLTMGGKLVMGRRTWESIGRPLPGRTSFVLSRGDLDLPDGVVGCTSLDQVLQLADASEDEERTLPSAEATVFCIGGGEIYRQLLPWAGQILLTEVDADIEGDTHFPDLDPGDWVEVAEEHRAADEHNDHATRFVHLVRVHLTGTDRAPGLL